MTVEYRWDRLSNSVRSLLDSIDSEGSFYAKGIAEDVNPGLEIEGVGGIGLPISQHDAQRLIQNSRQAPFGKGTETLVDTNVRNTWEIDAGQIKCGHPKWPAFLDSALQDACQQLGVPDIENVQAQLYKLLIYEEGAMFKPHKDSEKTTGMFGTLVIALPSLHEGGDVLVSFNGKSETLQTSVSSAWSTSYLAWYGDVTHEIKPVTSGHRIVLTYNMIHVGPSRAPAIANGDPRLAALRTELTTWSRTFENDDKDLASDPLPRYLVYMLNHQYTDESLCLSGLKGADFRRVKGLLSIAEAGDCECFLASIEKREHGGCDGLGPEDYARGAWHSLADVDEQSTHFRSIVATDGTKIVENINMEEEGVILRENEEDDPFDGDPFDEDFEGWTGNEGAYTTLWYRRSAVIIFSGRSNFDYFMSSTYDNEDSYINNYCNLLDYYGTRTASEPNECKGELDYLVGLVGTDPRSPEGQKWLTVYPAGSRLEHKSREIAAAAGACLRAGWLDRFTQIMRENPDLEEHGMEVRDFDEFLRFTEKYTFEQLASGLSSAIHHAHQASGSNLDSSVLAVSAIADGLKNYSPGQCGNSQETWLKASIVSVLSQRETLTTASIGPLIELLASRNDLTWLESVMPAFSAEVLDDTFAFALAAALSDAMADADNAIVDKVEESVERAYFVMLQELAPSMIRVISLPKTAPAPKRLSFARRRQYPFEPSPTPEQDHLLHNLEVLHQALLKVDSVDNTLSVSLLQQMEQECEHVAPFYFDALVFPFLDDVMGHLQENNVQISGTAYEQSINGIMRQYHARIVGLQPSPPTDWSRSVPKGLDECPTCKELREFIVHPDRPRMEFNQVFNVRKHVEKVIGNDFDTVTHRDSTPHTLEVVKTSRHFERSLQQWEAKCRTVESKITSFLNRHSISRTSAQQVVSAALETNTADGGAGEVSSSHSVLQARPNPPSGGQQHLPGTGEKRPGEDNSEENVRPTKRVDATVA